MNTKKDLPFLGNEGPLAVGSQEINSGGTLKPVSVRLSGMAGGFAVCVMRDPSFEAISRGLRDGDRYLDLRLEGDEWAALFVDVLKCPDADDFPSLPGESNEEWRKRYSLKFQQAIPSYPILARIHDLFIYVIYTPDEVNELRSESLRLQSMTSNELAVAMLKKLVQACDEASKAGSGLVLVPD